MNIASNLLWLEWILFSTFVSLLGVPMVYFPSCFSRTFHRFCKYGKSADMYSDGLKLHIIEIPKRWFYHFYLFACVFYSYLAWSLVQVYHYKNQVPIIIQILLDTVVGTQRKSSVTPESVIILMTLLLIHVFRRLLECKLMSVYSDAKINIAHYVMAFLFYFGVGLSLLAEAPGFEPGKNDLVIVSSNNFFTANTIVGIVLFAIASHIQFKSHWILSSLRKNSKGQVVTYQHSIPQGDWFTHVSCPHFFAEIVIYLSLSLILAGKSTTWWMVCCFVITNQIIVGLSNHQWYINTFKDYPKTRKAVIPYLL